MREKHSGHPRIGIALGAGGARGLAHIPVLELLDRMRIRPTWISGASIGAVFGALFASGMSGKEIRSNVEAVIGGGDGSWLDRLRDRKRLKWMNVFLPEIGRGGLISADRVADHLRELIRCDRFESLEIPLSIVAADYGRGESVVFESGELMAPLKGTMSIPGVFSPVLHEGRMLIDGGIVDPVPYEVLFERCDLVVAVDVTGVPELPGDGTPPALPDALRGAVRIMQRTLVDEKIRRREPDIFIRMNLRGIGLLQFGRAPEIFHRARPDIRRLREALKAAGLRNP